MVDRSFMQSIARLTFDDRFKCSICTGTECAKALRLFDSLEIKCFKKREFSNLLTGYVIPAVFNVWKRQQQSLLNSIKDTPICIASDMRVDSPGHSGLSWPEIQDICTEHVRTLKNKMAETLL